MKYSVFCLFVVMYSYAFTQSGPGNTLLFNGDNNRVVYPNLFEELSIPYTVSYWSKVTNASPVQSVIRSCLTSDDWYYGFWSITNSERLSIAFGDGTAALQPSARTTYSYFSDNSLQDQWVHHAYTVSNDEMSIYLNGYKVLGTYTGSGSWKMANTSDCETVIGFSRNNNGTHYYSGELDELRVYDRLLTQEEIRSSMCIGISKDLNGLNAYWKFDSPNDNSLIVENREDFGIIEGNVDWVISGAPVGDELIDYQYVIDPEDSFQVKIENTEFFIISEYENMVGYQIYKVNSQPNSILGASEEDFNEGYYGIVPIYYDAFKGRCIITLKDDCNILSGYFRQDNAHDEWSQFENQLEMDKGHIELVFESRSIEGLANGFTTNICEGDSIQLNASSNCVDSYLWNDGSESSKLTVFEAGSYWVDLLIDDVWLRVDFQVNKTQTSGELFEEEILEYCLHELPIQLEIANEKLSWNNIINTNSNPSIVNGMINHFGIYTFEYFDGCKILKDSIEVTTRNIDPSNIANVFTPNGDGINEYFEVPKDLEGSTLYVYNRSGLVVYENKNYMNNWQGQGLQSSVYYYHLISNCSGRTYKGWVQVLR